jgi:hypothetical protein
MKQAPITPDAAGERHPLPRQVIEIQRGNLGRLQRREEPLRNQMV